MSLVNDMLRDLDQRRSGSEPSSAAVKLMPAASEKLQKKGKGLLVLLCVLAVVAAGLSIVWLRMNADDTSQNLNIRPEIVTTNQPAEATEVAAGEVAARAEAVDSSEQVQDVALAPDESPREEVASDLTANIAQPDLASTTSNELANFDNKVERATNEVAVESSVPSTTTAGDQAVDTPHQNEADLPGLSSTDSRNSTQVAENATGAPSGQPLSQSNSGTTANVDLQSSASRDSVRGVVQISPEMRDTMAVKEALDLIANNKVAEAYILLENHIIANRNAHQSRETFAKLLLNENQLVAAYNLVESGLGLAPNHAGYKKVKARILIADGQVAEAVTLLSSRAPSVVADREYHEILATAQLTSRDFEGALITYTGLVSQDQSQGRWWYGFAASQDALGNTNAARQGYSQAIQKTNLSTNLRRRSQERLAALAE
ncbi:MAG: hypothetical protein RKH07_13730 [Gammaproteobacteria bacterium]